MSPRVVAAFAAALGTAAVIFTLGLLAEMRTGVGGESYITLLPVASLFVLLNILVGLPVVLLGGVPTWLLLRKRGVEALWPFALAGATFAIGMYLLMVAQGMGAPSDQRMAFSENLFRARHIPRIVFTTIAGGAGGAVFWMIGVRRVKPE